MKNELLSALEHAVNTSVKEYIKGKKQVPIVNEKELIVESTTQPLPSAHRQQLEELYQLLVSSSYITSPTIQDYVFLKPFNVSFQQNRILITVEDSSLKELLKSNAESILSFMKEQGYPLPTMPKLNLVESLEESSNLFGKTGYYDPSTYTISLFIVGRHPKDILRTFTHEVIHHIQNIENRLPTVYGNDTTEDSNLNEIEQEAYSKGGIVFRMWEDTIKSTKKN